MFSELNNLCATHTNESNSGGIEGEDFMDVEERVIIVREIDEEEYNVDKNKESEENVEEDMEPEENLEEEEDLAGRYEYEIEEDVADFVDEEFRPRYNIPESDDEAEEDDFDLKKRRMGKKNRDMLDLGAKFYTGYQFKQAVLEYALRKARNIKKDRWDKNKISFRCGIAGKCQWRVYCSYDEPSKMWVVKTRYASHSCSRNGKCKLLKSSVIANLFMDKLREEPRKYMHAEIQSLIKEKWKITSTRDQCQRGRLLALKWIEREYEDQFAHLRGYAEEIKFTNPGSNVIVEAYPNAAKEDVFDRFYVCIEGLRRSFMGSCRPIIGLDGTFLKAAVKGVLLTVVGHDANNQIYPVSWALVQSENGPNWLWFVKLIKQDLGLQTGDGIVIISDRAKGLISAVETELPSHEHRKCVKHIVENIKSKGHANKDLIKPMIWNLAWSYTRAEYEENRRKLLAYNKSLHDDVMKENPETWCLAFYKLGSFCEDVDNNATESYNATITKARAKSMVPMMEMIRRQAMARIAKRWIKADKWEGMNSKFVKKTLAAEKEKADKCTSIPATHGVHEVTLYGNTYAVNVKKQTCSCGKYQISGIPCEHAYGAMLNEGLEAEDYVSSWFATEIWKLNYETNMEPVRGPRFWLKRSCRLIVEPPEPDLPGRKKKSKKLKKRIKGKHESPKKKKKEVMKLPRIGRVIHCSNCGVEGHNYIGCKIHPKKKPRNYETSSDVSTEAQNRMEGSSQGADMIALTQPSQMTQDM